MLSVGGVLAGMLAVFAITTLAGRRPAEAVPFNGLAFDPPEPAPDFTLTDQHGGTFHLSDQAGNVVLLYFGFTHCPDECPATLGKWKSVREELGAGAAQVRFVMVTVDPERDTPLVLDSYLANFGADFVGLSGSLEELEDVAQDYSVFFQKIGLTEEEVQSAHLAEDPIPAHEHDDEEEVYLVNHTTLTYLIDRSGQLRLGYPIETPAAAILADLERLLE